MIKSKPIGEIEDETLILADQSEKTIFQLRQSVKALLEPKMGQEQAVSKSGVGSGVEIRCRFIILARSETRCRFRCRNPVSGSEIR